VKPDLNYNFGWIIWRNIHNSLSIWPGPSAVKVVYSDASTTGFGGFTVEHSLHILHGQWTQQDARENSTWRELRAVGNVLESRPKVEKLNGKVVNRQPKYSKNTYSSKEAH